MSEDKVRSDMYKRAGVDIDLAQDLMTRVKAKIKAASRSEMLAPVGGFGGLFQLDLSKYERPVLVSSVDGVGTKLMIAGLTNHYDDIGRDIVNHCVNDIVVQGAEPLYFLDYIGIGKLRSPLYERIVGGVADACAAVGCALLGGETAEMPGMYGNDFDLVGVITGVVEKDRLITGTRIKPGHVAIGLASNGLHTNGYSLARHVLLERSRYDLDSELKILGGESIGSALLKPHLCYWPAVKAALAAGVRIDGMAHVTGGGVLDNVPRILPERVDLVFDGNALPTPPIIRLIVEDGAISDEEAHRVFNMGVGMIWFVPPKATDAALDHCVDSGFKAAVCGEIIEGSRQVRMKR